MTAPDPTRPQSDRAPAGVRALRPKDAATLVVVDDRSGAPRILMGRRRDDLVFMPGKYVFPGGRVDPADRRHSAADTLRNDVEALLLQRMKGRPSATRARGLAMAAIREAFEETGIVLGAPATADREDCAGDTMTADGGQAGDTWAAFGATGHRPSLATLVLLARAITPPGRPRRYDTRFFLAPAASIAATIPHRDQELSHIDWFTLDAVRALDLPVITRAIVEDLGQRIAAQGLEPSPQPMPFYFFQAGAFRRQLLTADGAASDPIVWRR